MMKLKNVLILVLAAFLSPLLISCSDSSNGGGNSPIPSGAVAEKEGVDKIDFPSQPFSLLGVYTVKTYSINGNIRPASNSELRVNVDLPDAAHPIIQMRLSLNNVDNEFTKYLTLTEKDMSRLFDYIAETFENLGAEVSATDPYGLKFTMTAKEYPELVASGVIGENDTLVLNLEKIRNLKMGEGLDYSDEDDNKNEDNSVKAESVSITDTPAKVTHGDAPFQLSAEVLPENAANKKLSWASSHPKNAEVNASGYVTIKDYTDETITISAKTTDGSNKTAIYGFNMEKAQITGLSLASTSQTVQLRQDGSEVSLNIVPMVEPSYAEPYADITYSSSNNNIATVDAKGKVVAKSAGSAAITVSTGTHKATFNITVQAAPAVTVAVTGVTVTSAAKTYAKGDTVTVAFTLTPANTTETTVTYSGAASGSVIANNGSGTITLTNVQASGALTLTTEKNHSATYNIDARDKITNISFTDAGWTVDQDSSDTHAIERADDVKKSGTVTYASSNTNIATVNASTGQVTGKKNGAATITATFKPAYSGASITASYEIDVLGLVDFSSAQAFSDSAQGTYEITFFATRPGEATSGALKSQTDVPVTTDCEQYKSLFNSSNCTGNGFVKNIIVEQANFVGRATISIDNNGAAVIHTKILMTAHDMADNSNDDQYQYSVYRKTISNDPHNQGGTVKGITGRHLTGAGEWGTSTFDVRQFRNNRSKEIILYSKLIGKTIKVLGSNYTINPDTYVIVRKISSKPDTMDYSDITVAPFNKVKPTKEKKNTGSIFKPVYVYDETTPTNLGSTPPSY